MSVTIDPSIVFTILGLLTGLTILFIYLAIKHPERFHLAEFVRRWQTQILLGLLTTMFLLLIILPAILIPIPYGTAAVTWKRFEGGTQMNKVFGEGTLLIMPWNRAYMYSTQFQVLRHEFEAVTKNGLSIKIDTTIRYRVIKDRLPILHVNVGPEYVKRLIIPEIGSWARIEVAKYDAEDVYASQRLMIQQRIFKHLRNDLGIDNSFKDSRSADYVELQQLLINNIELPTGIRKAIVQKIEKVHLEQEYDTRIKIAQKEAVRKEAEAKGIAGFQKIVAGGISDTYLKWRGIEATLELATSDNAKVVVIGGGSDGLPIILNTDSALNGTESGKNANQTKDWLFKDDQPEQQHQQTNAQPRKTLGQKSQSQTNKAKQEESAALPDDSFIRNKLDDQSNAVYRQEN